MTKKQDRKYPREAQVARNDDWEPLHERLADVLGWSLDIAQTLAGDDEDDLRAIANVREFMHAWLEGRRAEVPIGDLFTTIAIVFAAIEIDRGNAISLLAPLQTMRDAPTRLPAMLRCPGAKRNEPPTVAIRRFPGRRTSAPFNQFAA